MTKSRLKQIREFRTLSMIRQQGAAAGVSAYDLLNRPSTAYFHLETSGTSMNWVDDLTIIEDKFVGLSSTAARMVFKRGGGELALWSSTDVTLYSDAGTSSVGQWDGATGNITLDAGSGDSPRLQFIGGSNNDTAALWLDDSATAGSSDFILQLSDAAGESVFKLQDSGGSSVLSIDSDGNLTLDDGSGDSPSIKFVGGSNDDTISIYLDDDGTTGASDVNFVLSDTAGASNLEIWSSAPASVLAFDSLGNIEFRNFGSWIGINSTNARLEITSNDTATLYGGLALSNSTGSNLWLRNSGDIVNDEASIYADPRLGLAADEGIHLFIDAANDGASDNFVIYHDAENATGATELMRLTEPGYLGIGTNNPGALTEWGFSTANMQFIDAGTAGATNRAWLYVDIGGTTGHIRVFGGP